MLAANAGNAGTQVAGGRARATQGRRKTALRVYACVEREAQRALFVGRLWRGRARLVVNLGGKDRGQGAY